MLYKDYVTAVMLSLQAHLLAQHCVLPLLVWWQCCGGAVYTWQKIVLILEVIVTTLPYVQNWSTGSSWSQL